VAVQLAHSITDLIYKCGGIDKRTIEKFEKVRGNRTQFRRPPQPKFCLSPLNSGGWAQILVGLARAEFALGQFGLLGIFTRSSHREIAPSERQRC
jgi:hypothetical protein